MSIVSTHGGTGSPSGSPRRLPQERAAWELAVQQLMKRAYNENAASARTPQDVFIHGTRPEQGPVVARANEIIQRLWDQANVQVRESSEDAEAGSSSVTVEQVYYHAIRHFDERFPLPTIHAPSLPLTMQQWLLLEHVSTADQGLNLTAAEKTQRINSWIGGGTDSLLRKTAQRLGEPFARQLEAAIHRLGTNRIRAFDFLELWEELLLVDDLTTQDLEQVVGAIAGDYDMGLHAAALLSTACRIGRVGDPDFVGRFGNAVQPVLEGDTLLDLACPGVTPENLAAQRNHYLDSWRRLVQQIRGNEHFKALFKEHSDGERAHLYNTYLKGLEKGWLHFMGSEQRPWRVLDTLPCFLNDCERGWESQINQLLDEIPGSLPPPLLALVHARNERRGLVESALATSEFGGNVHCRAALTQVLNDLLALGYTDVQLGLPENEVTLELVGRLALHICDLIDRSPEHVQAQATEILRALGPHQRGQIIDHLKAQFAKLLPFRDPQFLAAEDLKTVQAYQVALLDHLHDRQRLNELLEQQPISSITGRPLFSENAHHQLLAFARPDVPEEVIREAVHKLVFDAELEEFSRVIADEEHLRPYGLRLWLGLQGLVEFDDPALINFTLSTLPAQVAIRVAAEAAEAARAREEAQAQEIARWIQRCTLNAHEFRNAPEYIRNNPDIVLKAVERNSNILLFAPEVMRHRFDIALAVVSQSGLMLEHLPAHFQDDDRIVLAAVQNAGLSLKFASANRKNDRHIVRTAIAENYRALEFASEELRGAPDVVLEAVQRNGRALQFASPTLQNTLEIVLAAVEATGKALEFASVDMRSSKRVVLAAVANYGEALQFASATLQDDHDIVIAAVRNSGKALHLASARLRGDFDIVLEAVGENGSALEYASSAMQSNPTIVRTAIRNRGSALRYASDEMRDDFNIVAEAVQRDGLALQFASEDLRKNIDIIRMAVRQNGYALNFAHPDVLERLRRG